MRALLLIALTLLAACGRQGVLEPAPGAALPPRPVDTAVAPTPDEMLRVPAQAAPDRVDDPVRNADERREDGFNLPPPR